MPHETTTAEWRTFPAGKGIVRRASSTSSFAPGENVAVAVGGNEFYKLQSDGTVVWLDNAGPYSSIVEQANSVGIHAVGGLVYSRHDDGTIWR